MQKRRASRRGVPLDKERQSPTSAAAFSPWPAAATRCRRSR